jgi:hypothetical protein
MPGGRSDLVARLRQGSWAEIAEERSGQHAIFILDYSLAGM